MNKKFIGVLIGILILFFIIFGGNIMSSEENIDSSYYVLANDNLFSKIGMLLNDCCYYIVDIILGGINSVFNMFLN